MARCQRTKKRENDARPHLQLHRLAKVGLVGFLTNFPLPSKTVIVIVLTVSRVRGKQAKNPTIPTSDNFCRIKIKPHYPHFQTGTNDQVA